MHPCVELTCVRVRARQLQPPPCLYQKVCSVTKRSIHGTERVRIWSHIHRIARTANRIARMAKRCRRLSFFSFSRGAKAAVVVADVVPAVELLGSPYYKGVALPRIPSVHKLGTKSRIAQRSEHATVDPRGTYSHAGRSTSEPRRQYSRSSGTAQHASTTKIPRNRAVLDAARCTNGILRQSNARRVTLKSQAPVKQ